MGYSSRAYRRETEANIRLTSVMEGLYVLMRDPMARDSRGVQTGTARPRVTVREPVPSLLPIWCVRRAAKSCQQATKLCGSVCSSRRAVSR